MQHILVHDLGTTGDKAALFDERGRLIASYTESYPTLSGRDGGFEQNPADWLGAVCAGTRRVMAMSGVKAPDIAGISLSGHMMGVVALDSDRRPLRPAILHSDIRSRPQVRQIAGAMPTERIRQIAGNPLDVHYPWAKIAWLRDNEPDSYKAARMFVQSKDYVGSWLTGGDAVTDYSDASLYGCWDFHQMRWSDDLCHAAGIDRAKLPEVRSAGSHLGGLKPEAARALGLLPGTPVLLGFGDGASAALGAGAWGSGTCYNYVGSTSWVASTTPAPVIDPEGRLFTIALTPDRFSSIGTVQCAGSAWDWAVTRLCDAHFETAEALASASPPGSEGLVFLPYLSGERSPIWNENARGVWFGLSSSHGAGDLLRSVLEGVSLALSTVLADICRCTSEHTGDIRLIGGGLRNPLWRDILVSAFGRPGCYPDEVGEATARGAFCAASVGLKMVSSFEESCALVPPTHRVVPDAGMAASYQAIRPLFESLYGNLIDAFDDLARLRSTLRAFEVGDASV